MMAVYSGLYCTKEVITDCYDSRVQARIERHGYCIEIAGRLKDLVCSYSVCIYKQRDDGHFVEVSKKYVEDHHLCTLSNSADTAFAIALAGVGSMLWDLWGKDGRVEHEQLCEIMSEITGSYWLGKQKPIVTAIRRCDNACI